jgi:hypothetical protein
MRLTVSRWYGAISDTSSGSMGWWCPKVQLLSEAVYPLNWSSPDLGEQSTVWNRSQRTTGGDLSVITNYFVVALLTGLESSRSHHTTPLTTHGDGPRTRTGSPITMHSHIDHIESNMGPRCMITWDGQLGKDRNIYLLFRSWAIRNTKVVLTRLSSGLLFTFVELLLEEPSSVVTLICESNRGRSSSSKCLGTAGLDKIQSGRFWGLERGERAIWLFAGKHPSTLFRQFSEVSRWSLMLVH